MRTIDDVVAFLKIEEKKLEKTGDPEGFLKGIKWVLAMLVLEGHGDAPKRK